MICLLQKEYLSKKIYAKRGLKKLYGRYNNVFVNIVIDISVFDR